MTLAQFLRMIAAGRWTLLLCIAACLGGAMWFASGLPPTYEARARVLLELASPDLVTGTEVNSKSTESYVRTQQLLAMSERVALRVVDKLGWASSPAVLEAFASAPNGAADVRNWAARRIMADTAAIPLEGGGTMEIVYRASNVEAATLVAGLIRESYIETSLGLQTDGAKRRADRYDVLAAEARARLSAAEGRYTALQRQVGVVADVNGNDIEADAINRLQTNAIAAQSAGVQDGGSRDPPAATRLRGDILSLDQQIATATNSLGAANPLLQSMLARRDSLRATLAQVLAAGRPSGAAAGRAMANAAEAAYRDERKRVLARGPDALRLVQAQRQVTLLRADLARIMRNGAELRMQSERTESGLVVMGDVIAQNEPVAPNIPLIAALATIFGSGLGLVAVVLDGLLRREVLGVADLAAATGVPVIGVVPSGAAQSPLGTWLARRRQRKLTAALVPA